LVYLSEDNIDCKFRNKENHPWTLKENITCGEEIVSFNFSYTSSEMFGSTIFINLCINNDSLLTRISRSFNDQSSTDFVVKCHDKKFFVHQHILKQQSEYFDGVLRNDCVESKDKQIIIEDFEPDVVEILLRYLYTGVLSLAMKCTKILNSLLQIADKYNFTEVVDTMDNFCARRSWTLLSPERKKTKEEYMVSVKDILSLFEKNKLPKTAAMLFFLKNSGGLDITDDEWSRLTCENPEFSLLVANTGGRKDYQSWVQQHRNWHFVAFESKNRNIHHLIVGALGEMKGAVKCTPIV